MSSKTPLTLLLLILMAGAACLPVQTLYAQEYKAMMGDASYNLYDVIQTADTWFQSHPTGKGSGFKGYQRWKYDSELLFYPSGNRSDYHPEQFYTQYKVFINSKGHISGRNGRTVREKSAMGNPVWTELGPWHANNVLNHYAPGLGRIDAVWIDPADSMRLYIGARNGGFWYTTDGGVNWDGSTDQLSGVGVSSIAVVPGQHDTLLINTKVDPFINSNGIWYSEDAGLTWSATPWNSAWISNTTTIRKIAFNPLRPNEAFAGTTDGLYRSTDFFQTWDTLIWNRNIRDFEFQPGNADRMYLTWSSNPNDSVFVSSDGGISWSGVFANGLTSNSEVAVTPDDSNYVYVANGNAIWRSTDAGASFSVVTTSLPDWFGSFGVLDTDKDRVLYGGIDTHLSTDGGNTWTQITFWSQPASATYIHADLREVEAYNGRFFVGTDGYVAKSPDGGYAWNRISDGVPTREFYRIGVSPTHESLIIGGSQDNGTSFAWEGDWYEWLGADGMECAINRSNPKVIYGEWQYGGLHISYDQGNSRAGIRPAGQSGSWITPFVMDQNHPCGIIIGYDSLYRTYDNGANWSVIGTFNGSDLDDLAISPINSDIIYASEGNQLWRTTNGGTSWTEITGSLPNRSITDIALHPLHPDTLAVTYATYNLGQQIYQSYNGGQTWTNISYDMPTIPSYTAIYQTEPQERLYMGTRVGVYTLHLDSTSWNSYTHNLPLGYVRELEIHAATNMLRAGFYGRGLWEAPLLGKETAPQIHTIETGPFVTLTRPTEHSDIHILATITDNSQVDSAWVTWSVNNTTFSNTEYMEHLVGDTFRTLNKIPNQNPNDLVHFKVYAKDNSGEVTVSDRIVFKVHPYTCVSYPLANAGPDRVLCPGDSVTLNAGGNYYEYVWDNGVGEGKTHRVAPEETTLYKVTITDENGCSSSDDMTVFVSSLEVDFGQDTSICQGQTLTLNADPANENPNAMFQWSTGDSLPELIVDTAGVYWATASDSLNCTDSDTITVGLDSVPIVDLGPDRVLCEGDTAILDADPNNNYPGATYWWGAGQTNRTRVVTSGGTYTVVLTSADNCEGSDQALIAFNSLPAVEFDFGNSDTVCSTADTVVLPLGQPATGDYSGPGVSGNTFDPATAGIGAHPITYTFTDGNGCTNSATDTMYVELCNGREEEIETSPVALYPNPSGIPAFHLQFDFSGRTPPTDLEIWVLNALGQKVEVVAVPVHGGKYQVDVELAVDLANGNYLVQVYGSAGAERLFSGKWQLNRQK